MRYAAHLTGAGALADDFESHLDRLPGAVMVGDESTSIVTLTYDVWGLSRVEALDHARDLAWPIVMKASGDGQHVSLVVGLAERESLLSRLRRRRRARA